MGSQPNVVVDLTLNAPRAYLFKAFCDPLIVIDPGTAPYQGLACGPNMVRMANPFHAAETVTKFDAKTLHHCYTVTQMKCPFSCLWRGFKGELYFEEGPKPGETIVHYRAYMDVTTDAATALLTSAATDLFIEAAKKYAVEKKAGA